MPTLDEIRREAVERAAAAERNYKLAFWGAILVETIFFVAFLVLADLKNRNHILLLLCAVGIYGILALALVALGAHVSRCTLRVLKAIALLDAGKRE
jgi:hypothetical protein